MTSTHPAHAPGTIDRPGHPGLSAAQGPGPRPGPSTATVLATIGARAFAEKAAVVWVLALFGLGIGVAVGALWPPLRDTFAQLSDSLPAAFENILGGIALASPAGWLNAEMLSILGPGFLIATAIISAGAATAGEEQSRTLGLVLSTGISRTTFLAAKTAAVITHLLLVTMALFVGMVVGNAIGGMGLELADLAAAALWMFLLGLVYAALALTTGALSGNQRLTTALTGGVAAASFVLAVFLPLHESLSGWSKLNLWYPYSGHSALVDGLDGTLAAVMVVIAAAVLLIGFIGFSRRTDLRG